MNFEVLFMGSNIWGKQVSIQKKIVSNPRVSVRSLHKKDNRCMPDRQMRYGYTNPRLQQVLHCSECPWKNEYASPRWCRYTNWCRQQVLQCPKCPWPNKYPSAPAPAPDPFFFPDLSSTASAHPSFFAIKHTSHYADFLEVHVLGAGFKVARAVTFTPLTWIQLMS
jgi:hypothetical protein